MDVPSREAMIAKLRRLTKKLSSKGLSISVPGRYSSVEDALNDPKLNRTMISLMLQDAMLKESKVFGEDELEGGLDKYKRSTGPRVGPVSWMSSSPSPFPEDTSPPPSPLDFIGPPTPIRSRFKDDEKRNKLYEEKFMDPKTIRISNSESKYGDKSEADKPIRVWIVGSDIPLGGGRGGKGGGGGGKGGGGGGDERDETPEEKKARDRKNKIAGLGALFGMDMTSYLFSGGNPYLLAGQIANQRIRGIGNDLASDRFGNTASGVGGAIGFGGMTAVNPLGLAGIAFTELAGALGKGVEALRSWNDAILKANFQFAEFSAGMATVQAQQEVRRIHLERERGERRAPWAARHAESADRLERTLAPWEDRWAQIKGDVATWFNDAIDRFMNTDAMQQLAQWLGVQLAGPEGQGAIGDWVENIRTHGRGGWVDFNHMPNNNNPTPRLGGGGQGNRRFNE